MVSLKDLKRFPDYDPPKDHIGQKSNTCVYWNKALASYKTNNHEKKWVYMYVKTNLPPEHLDRKFINRPRNADSFESQSSEISVLSDMTEKSEEARGPIIDIATVIYDRFPKSKYHLLVLPLLVGANNPSEFKKSHLMMLKGVHDLARMIAKHLEIKYGAGPFSIGYHAHPSMDDLHIHIISKDFESEFLKSKQHYNSFVNEEFFLTIDRVESDLKNHGKVLINIRSKDSLKDDLRCHVCSEKITKRPGIPSLQEHLQEHLRSHVK
jgi:aprataxin